jgi:hypothetical protein
MGSGFSLSGWFGKSRAAAPGAALETVAVRSVRRRRWKFRAAVTCGVAVALLFVAFYLARRQRLAEAEATCPLVQTNSSLWRGADPTGISPRHEFWVDWERNRKTTVKQHLFDLGARRKGGKVVGPDGAELYFYSYTDDGTRHNHQQNEIAALERQGFRVVLTYPYKSHFP